MDTPPTPVPGPDALGQLQWSILDLEKATRRQTKAMIVLTWALAFLTLVLAGTGDYGGAGRVNPQVSEG